MVANHDVVSPVHLQVMHKEYAPPPESWGVWIGHYERQIWDGEWLTRWFTVMPNADYQALESFQVDFSNGSSTTFVLNKLFVVVGQCPDPHFGHRWSFDGSTSIKSKLRKIWPPVREIGIRWPPTALTDEDANAVTDALILAVKRRPRIL